MNEGKHLDEFLLTVSEDTGNLVEAMIEGAKHFFEEYKEVPPAMTCFAPGFSPMVFPSVHHNDAEKACVWAFLRFLRETHPVVVLVSEIWASKRDKGNDPYKQTRPSEDPKRTEMVMISVWDESRTILIGADITRNPDKLGEFTVRSDSNDEGCELEGELCKGEPFKRKEMRYEP